MYANLKIFIIFIFIKKSLKFTYSKFRIKSYVSLKKFKSSIIAIKKNTFNIKNK